MAVVQKQNARRLSGHVIYVCYGTEKITIIRKNGNVHILISPATRLDMPHPVEAQQPHPRRTRPTLFNLRRDVMLNACFVCPRVRFPLSRL